jgi:hypothetical protein
VGLADGGDTIVIGMTQEPTACWRWSPAWPPSAWWIARLRVRSIQPVQLRLPAGAADGLSTIESGLATTSRRGYAAGDMVYNMTAKRLSWRLASSVFDADGNVSSTPAKAPCQCCNWL